MGTQIHGALVGKYPTCTVAKIEIEQIKSEETECLFLPVFKIESDSVISEHDLGEETITNSVSTASVSEENVQCCNLNKKNNTIRDSQIHELLAGKYPTCKVDKTEIEQSKIQEGECVFLPVFKIESDSVISEHTTDLLHSMYPEEDPLSIGECNIKLEAVNIKKSVDKLEQVKHEVDLGEETITNSDNMVSVSEEDVQCCNLSKKNNTFFSVASKKYNELNLQKRIEVIQYLENNSARKAAEFFRISKTTVNNIRNRKTELLRRSEIENTELRRKARKTNYEEINRATLIWVHKMLALKAHISGVMIQEAALGFAKDLGITGFCASYGWLASLTKRNLISQKVICEEANKANLTSNI
ncbi:uncharacterized protein LOC142320218 isoform X2 [Lycorma delicatula]